jgi:hypothetical protein
MSSYSDPLQQQEREPKQSHYMKAPGMNLNTIASQSNPILESYNLTYMNLTERAFHQTTNKLLNPQMKNQQHLSQNQKTPVTRSPHNTMHQQLKKQLQHQQHQEPPTLTIEENPKSYHLQTHTTLALLLLANNNNQLQLIWRLRLLQLQQQ